MDKTFIILGGGVAGCAAALELAGRGLSSVVIEQAPRLGGRALDFGCKATDECNLCGLCSASDVLAQVGDEPLVTPVVNARLDQVRKTAGGWEAAVRVQAPDADAPAEDRTIAASGLVVAVGMKPFDAAEKPQFGYGKVANVVTGLDLERMFRQTNAVTRPSDSAPPKSVAFVQCIGSRDPHTGRNFCSHICCKYAIRFGQMIVDRDPEAEVTIFYMDIQTSGKGFHERYERLKGNERARFIRTLPGAMAAGEAGGVVLKYEDPATGRAVSDRFDLAVLSIGQNPPESAGPLAGMLGVELDQNGFFADGEGLWFVGSCHGPRSITETIEDAKILAARISQTM